MQVHVCHNDGAPIGEFLEADFRDKIFAGELAPDCFYWYEGMVEWKPISEYRALARTQRIEIVEEEFVAEPVVSTPAPATGNDAVVKGGVVSLIGLVLAILGGLKASMAVLIIGVLVLLGGVFLAVASRLRS